MPPTLTQTPPDSPDTGSQALRWLDECGVSSAPDLSGIKVAAHLLELVPRNVAVRHGLLPLWLEEGRLVTALKMPFDIEGLDALALLAGVPITPVVATTEAIAAAIERNYGRGDRPIEELLENSRPGKSAEFTPPAESSDAGARNEGVIGARADEAPIISLVQRIIRTAIKRRASDIHLEPLETRLRVRYRVDGVMVEAESLPKELQLPVVSRVKIMADISIAEKRMPQDGRLAFPCDGRPVDLRVSSLPTVHGESIVMRILEKDGLILDLAEMGLAAADAGRLGDLIAGPDGIVLVTGPTGSGKTTTLYGCLHSINGRGKKIITVEDPVEYQLNGINQVPVRQVNGMTFASALRTMLRQAPNVVMVGEIRDRETAEIAIHASLTGHMVFSTLHTNDATGAVTRLIDLGVNPFLVSASLRASIAQRLVRKNCPACSRPEVPSATERAALRSAAADADDSAFARGAGCRHCHFTGFAGRTGIFEIFTPDADLQRMIHVRAGAAVLRAAARAKGMRTMREDGLRKASAGLTTVAEIVSLTPADPC